MAPLPMPLNDLEGHFYLLFESFLTPILCETWHKLTSIACHASVCDSGAFCYM